MISLFFSNFKAPAGQTAAQAPHAVQREFTASGAVIDSRAGMRTGLSSRFSTRDRNNSRRAARLRFSCLSETAGAGTPVLACSGDMAVAISIAFPRMAPRNSRREPFCPAVLL